MNTSNVAVNLAMSLFNVPIGSVKTSLVGLEAIKSFARPGSLENKPDFTAFTRPRGTSNKVDTAIRVTLHGT